VFETHACRRRDAPGSARRPPLFVVARAVAEPGRPSAIASATTAAHLRAARRRSGRVLPLVAHPPWDRGVPRQPCSRGCHGGSNRVEDCGSLEARHAGIEVARLMPRTCWSVRRGDRVCSGNGTDRWIRPQLPSIHRRTPWYDDGVTDGSQKPCASVVGCGFDEAGRNDLTRARLRSPVAIAWPPRCDNRRVTATIVRTSPGAARPFDDRSALITTSGASANPGDRVALVVGSRTSMVAAESHCERQIGWLPTCPAADSSLLRTRGAVARHGLRAGRGWSVETAAPASCCGPRDEVDAARECSSAAGLVGADVGPARRFATRGRSRRAFVACERSPDSTRVKSDPRSSPMMIAGGGTRPGACDTLLDLGRADRVGDLEPSVGVVVPTQIAISTRSSTHPLPLRDPPNQPLRGARV